MLIGKNLTLCIYVICAHVFLRFSEETVIVLDSKMCSIYLIVVLLTLNNINNNNFQKLQLASKERTTKRN